MGNGQWVPPGVEVGPLRKTESWVAALPVSGWLLPPSALTVAFQRMPTPFLRHWECPVPAGVGTQLGELSIFCLSQPQFLYLDHGVVTLPARLPSTSTAQLPALALCSC